jgi:hypothetical protein
MNIYVAHSTSFNFKEELYAPLRASELNSSHTIVLPHEESSAQFNSKEYLKTCDAVIAEVSYPSTGEGIELGWANLYGVPIIAIYKEGTKPSGALKAVTDTLIEYADAADMIQHLSKCLLYLRK